MSFSLRLRLALLSALLAGAALAGFAVAAWWSVYDSRVERVEADLAALVEREAGRRLPPAGWQQVEAGLARALGAHDSGVLLAVEDATGKSLYRSPSWPSHIDSAGLPWPPAPRRSGPAELLSGAPHLAPPALPPAIAVVPLSIDGEEWRAALAASPEARIAVAMSLADTRAGMAALRNAFGVAVPLALLLIGLGSWIVAARALAPVRRLNASIREVTVAGLGRRLAVDREEGEFRELAVAFNDMLARLERSFLQASRFSADAAHELKTPLTVLQGQLEREIRAAEADSPQQAVLVRIQEEAHRLTSITRKLLLLSQADASQLRLQVAPVDLTAMLEELAEDARLLAPGLTVTLEAAPGLIVRADAGLLKQILRNLLSNAVKYNVAAGWIRIRASAGAGETSIVVSNPSAGIPAEARERLFERFYRADAARIRRVDGVGLGLPLARELARAHGGELDLTVDAENVVSLRLSLPAGT